jgi:hypothetical protein
MSKLILQILKINPNYKNLFNKVLSILYITILIFLFLTNLMYFQRIFKVIIVTTAKITPMSQKRVTSLASGMPFF